MAMERLANFSDEVTKRQRLVGCGLLMYHRCKKDFTFFIILIKNAFCHVFIC